ncbi:hypothetical protein RWV98_08290 [Agathobaculum sp. NTUH-O15-33]|nr:hypothetical protein [Agathobaculum sp. NTUH-O15-33]WNX86253.1 hypothetical protein RWV98_08290 [Agathobaculum sp. NTUH-O15-33]
MLMLILVFGSSATFFFWTKWLGKVTAIVAGKRSIERTVHKEEWFVLKGLAAVTVLVCVGFPIIAKNLVADYLVIHFARVPGEVISQGNMLIMSFMVVLLVVLPLLAFGRSNKKLVHVNLAGENMGDDLTFRGSMDIPVPVSLRNWYMETLFSERWMLLGGSIVNIVIIILSFSELLGGVLHV